MIKKYILIISLICSCIAQDYNPCKDKRFISLTKIELDDMSDRQYNYFLKKEEECSKYKARRSRVKIKSKNRIKSKDSKKEKSIQKALKLIVTLLLFILLFHYSD